MYSPETETDYYKEVPQGIIKSVRRSPWRLFDQTKSILKSLFKLSGRPRRPGVTTKEKSQLRCSLKSTSIHYIFQKVFFYYFCIFVSREYYIKFWIIYISRENMDKMKFEFVLWHGCFTEKKITSFPLKQCIFFFRERSEQHFAQLFKFDSSSSFRNISINKKIEFPIT